VDARHKAGHDEFCSKSLFQWPHFESDPPGSPLVTPAMAQDNAVQHPTEVNMSWLPSNDPVLADPQSCDALDLDFMEPL
jgi:hypothetical protein